jgi:hypothetical protein
MIDILARLFVSDVLIFKAFSDNKQLLDEAEHDIKNYSDRGQCYPPQLCFGVV